MSTELVWEARSGGIFVQDINYIERAVRRRTDGGRLLRGYVAETDRDLAGRRELVPGEWGAYVVTNKPGSPEFASFATKEEAMRWVETVAEFNRVTGNGPGGKRS